MTRSKSTNQDIIIFAWLSLQLQWLQREATNINVTYSSLFPFPGALSQYIDIVIDIALNFPVPVPFLLTYFNLNPSMDK